nr:spindle and kinetochore-associated protein 1 homolog [Ipomoea batatas]
MDVKEAGTSLDSLISAFNARIAELQQLVIARNSLKLIEALTETTEEAAKLLAANMPLEFCLVQPETCKDELSFESLKVEEACTREKRAVPRHHYGTKCLMMNSLSSESLTKRNGAPASEDPNREETEAIPKAKKLIEALLKQQKKLQTLAANMPLNLSVRMTYTTQDTIKCVQPEPCKDDLSFESLKVEEPAPREKKGRASPPLWYLSADDLNSCPASMRGRLTLDKVNAAINDMAMYAEANSQLITTPRKKLTDNIIEEAMESNRNSIYDCACIAGEPSSGVYLLGVYFMKQTVGNACETTALHVVIISLQR